MIAIIDYGAGNIFSSKKRSGLSWLCRTSSQNKKEDIRKDDDNYTSVRPVVGTTTYDGSSIVVVPFVTFGTTTVLTLRRKTEVNVKTLKVTFPGSVTYVTSVTVRKSSVNVYV